MQIPLFPEQASTISTEVDQLLYFLVAVSVFFTLLIFAAIFYFAIRYRRRSENEMPEHVHTGLTLEILWTVIPFGLTMIMFTWGASIFFRESRPPDDAMQPCRFTSSENSGCGSCSTWKGSAKSTNCTFRSAAP
jgi:cytochrome c oxidase subunit 2